MEEDVAELALQTTEPHAFFHASGTRTCLRSFMFYYVAFVTNMKETKRLGRIKVEYGQVTRICSTLICKIVSVPL